MDVKTLLREQFKSAHNLLEGTMQAVTEEQAHWTPPGKAIPVGATYAHVILSEDMMLNGMVKRGAPLFATTFAGKTGLGENPPPPDQPWDEWSRSVKIDLGALRAYAKAVYAATDEYIGSATDDELARELDLSGFGMGEAARRRIRRYAHGVPPQQPLWRSLFDEGHPGREGVSFLDAYSAVVTVVEAHTAATVCASCSNKPILKRP